MRAGVALTLLALAGLGCSGGDDSSAADASTQETTRAVDLNSEDSALLPDVESDETEEPQTLPEPATPFPGLDNGTFVWSDGTNKISFTHKDGFFLLQEASFTCVGESGCKAKQDFAKLTCNQAYTKGYSATLEAGKFTITGVKGSDTVVGSVQAKDRIALLYQQRPSVSCCQKDFYFEAVWQLKEDCATYSEIDCDPYTDEHCEAGFNCIFGAYDRPVCMIAGEKAVGEECATQGLCSDGYCMSLMGMDKNRCLKYCKTDSDCGYQIACIGLEGKKWKVCSLPASAFETCNLLEQNCTKAGEACYYTSSTVFQPVCMAEGTGREGDQCSQSSDCAAGFDCIADKECMPLCTTQEGGEPGCPSAFTTCQPLYPGQKAGYCPD